MVFLQWWVGGLSPPVTQAVSYQWAAVNDAAGQPHQRHDRHGGLQSGGDGGKRFYFLKTVAYLLLMM